MNVKVCGKVKLFPPGFKPGTFHVLGERDNHYTTETTQPLVSSEILKKCMFGHSWPSNFQRKKILEAQVILQVRIWVPERP